MTPPRIVELVHEQGSHEVEAILSGLLDAARNRHITGLVFGAVFRRDGRVMCDAAGSLYRDQLRAIGVAALLQHYMEDVVHREEDTTL